MAKIIIPVTVLLISIFSLLMAIYVGGENERSNPEIQEWGNVPECFGKISGNKRAISINKIGEETPIEAIETCCKVSSMDTIFCYTEIRRGTITEN